MTRPSDAVVCRIQLLGPLRVLDATGRDVTPAGRKIQGMLALLALSPDGRRSRVWLRDKLWSDRPEGPAAACLRQALSELRKALGQSAGDILQADNVTVRLRLDRVAIDAAGRDDPARERRELLEGIDVGDPEFEDWLATERQAWAGVRAEQERMPRAAEPRAVSPGLVRPDDRAGVSPAARAVRVALLPGGADHGAHGPALARVTELVAKCLLDTGAVAVTMLGAAAGGAPEPEPGPAGLPGIDYLFRTWLVSGGGGGRLSMSVTRSADRALIWVDTTPVTARVLQDIEPTALYPCVQAAVDRLLQVLTLEPGGSTSGLVLSAVDAMFRLDENALAQAERTLRTAALSGSAQADAWLAFLISFRIGQRHGVDRRAVLEEARELARRALSRAPQNALVLALVGHVRAFLLQDYEGACTLFERAIAVNPMQPLAWDLYATTHAYIGRAPAGLACARWARTLGAASPYRYYFDTSVCINASLSGRHEDAVRAGRRVLEERPRYNSVLRFLVSSYGHLGDRTAAEETLQRLIAVEPDFSIASLREAGYPLVRAQAEETFVAGLVKAGIRRRDG